MPRPPRPTDTCGGSTRASASGDRPKPCWAREKLQSAAAAAAMSHWLHVTDVPTLSGRRALVMADFSRKVEADARLNEQLYIFKAVGQPLKCFTVLTTLGQRRPTLLRLPPLCHTDRPGWWQRG